MPAPSGAVPRILIVRLSAIGDVIVTTPVSRALREAFPDAHIAWAVEALSAPVLEANPYLDEVLVWERSSASFRLRDYLEFVGRLRRRRFDWIVDCQGNLRSGVVSRLATRRGLVGNTQAKESASIFYDVRVPRDPHDRSSRRRCLDLLRPLGVETADKRMVLRVTPEEQAAARGLLDRSAEHSVTRIALIPATTWPQKHWLPDRWGALAALIKAELGANPLILGGPADRPLAAAIQAAAGGACTDLAGQTSLRSALAVLSLCSAAVAVDTGLMHASVALGVPTVGLAGASWWPGFEDYEGFSLIREPMACSPCLHRPTCAGRFDCMAALDVERVANALRGCLSRVGACG